MKALVTLEWRMNIPVLTKLESNLSDFKKQIKLTDIDTNAKPLREIRTTDQLYHAYDHDRLKKYNTGSASSEVIKYTERWINDVPEPTWRNFFKILKHASPELSQLAYQIKDLFHATEAAEDTAKLKADLVHLRATSKSAKEMVKELESSVAFCESILQKVQKADEEKEQLAMQLQVQAKELSELNEQLKLYQQAEKENETRKLTEKDLPPLMRQLKLHAARWKEIGLHLGFLPGELANIEARPNLSQGAPVSWFGSILESWLQWAPGDSRGSLNFATLEDLKEALSEAGLGACAIDLRLKVM